MGLLPQNGSLTSLGYPTSDCIKADRRRTVPLGLAAPGDYSFGNSWLPAKWRAGEGKVTCYASAIPAVLGASAEDWLWAHSNSTGKSLLAPRAWVRTPTQEWKLPVQARAGHPTINTALRLLPTPFLPCLT